MKSLLASLRSVFRSAPVPDSEPNATSRATDSPPPEDMEFVKATLPKVEGYLANCAALMTLWLLRAQNQAGNSGPILEIGVWKGKFLSTLYQGSHTPVIGIDIFRFGNTEEQVLANFKDAFGEASRLTLVTNDSSKMTAKDLIALANQNFQFISIDGDHTADAVCHDLALSEAALAKDGIIALDDFVNPNAIGVSEGTYRYFFTHPNQGVVPFVYCANKLFICRTEFYARYLEEVERFVSAYQGTLKICEEINELLEKGQHWVKQDLLGSKCFIIDTDT